MEEAFPKPVLANEFVLATDSAGLLLLFLEFVWSAVNAAGGLVLSFEIRAWVCITTKGATSVRGRFPFRLTL